MLCHTRLSRGKLGQTLSRPPGCARGPGVAPGRDQAAVPGHEAPSRAAPGEREGVSVSAANVRRYEGETAKLSVWEQCQCVSHSSQVREGPFTNDVPL